MKKYFRLMLVGALALVMVLSLASCSKLEMDDVEDALEEYAEDNDDEYTFSTDLDELNMDKKDFIKALEVGFEEIDDLKEGIKSVCMFTNTEKNTSCMIVEFDSSSDAKKIGKELEDSIEDVMIEVYIEYMSSIMGGDDSNLGLELDKEYFKEMAEKAVEELMDESFSKFTAEVKGNIVFFGNKSVVETALEAIEDAK